MVNCARSLGIPATSGFHHLDHYSTYHGLGTLPSSLPLAQIAPTHLRNPGSHVALAKTLTRAGIPGVRVVVGGRMTLRSAKAQRPPAGHLGIDSQSVVYLYVGRMAPEKNLGLVCRYRRIGATMRAHGLVGDDRLAKDHPG